MSITSLLNELSEMTSSFTNDEPGDALVDLNLFSPEDWFENCMMITRPGSIPAEKVAVRTKELLQFFGGETKNEQQAAHFAAAKKYFGRMAVPEMDLLPKTATLVSVQVVANPATRSFDEVVTDEQQVELNYSVSSKPTKGAVNIDASRRVARALGEALLIVAIGRFAVVGKGTLEITWSPDKMKSSSSKRSVAMGDDGPILLQGNGEQYSPQYVDKAGSQKLLWLFDMLKGNHVCFVVPEGQTELFQHAVWQSFLYAYWDATVGHARRPFMNPDYLSLLSGQETPAPAESSTVVMADPMGLFS